MLFKKTASFLMAAVIAVSVLVVPYSAYAEENNKTADKDVVEFVNALNINGVHDNIFDSESITRADFAILLLKTLNMSNYSFTKNSAYADVPTENAAYEAINILREVGIFSASDNFYPNRAITLNEALTAIVRGLGYEEYALSKGGYPAGYIKAATVTKLLSGTEIADNEKLTYAEAITVLYNSLFAPLMKSDYSDNGSYIDSDSTLLTDNFDIYETEGTVNADSKTSIDGGDVTKDNCVRIDDTVYNIGKSDIESYLGFKIKIYYEHNSRTNEKTIAFVEKRNDNLLEISARDIDSFKDNVYKYTDSNNKNKEKKATLSTGAIIVYNGSFAAYNESKMKPEMGSVILYDSNSDGKYDVVSVRAYKNMVVDTVDLQNNYIGGKYDAGMLDLSSGNGRTVSIKDSYGGTFELGDLFEWDVLTYLENADGSNIDITVTRDYVYGSIEGIKETGGMTVITVDGEKLTLSPSYPDSNDSRLDLGTNGDFLKDSFGDIAAYVNVDSGKYVFGYVIKTALKSSMADTMSLLIFTEDGAEAKSIDAASNVKLDGTRVSGTSDKISALSADGGQLIRYGLNSEGKINFIDTVYTDPEKETKRDALFMSCGKASGERRFWDNSILGSDIPINSKTKLFIVPTLANRDNQKMYGLKDINYFKQFVGSTSYADTEAYMTSPDSVYAEVLVYYWDYKDGFMNILQNDVGLIEGISTSTDEEGNVKETVSIWTYGKREELFTKEIGYLAANGIGTGDIITYGRNYKGEIENAVRVYDYNPDTKEGTYEGIKYALNDQIGETQRFMAGYAYRVKGGVLQLTDADLSSLGDTTPNVENHIVSAYKIVVYDDSGREATVRQGTVSDIMDYVHYSEKCTKVFTQKRAGQARVLIVYRTE